MPYFRKKKEGLEFEGKTVGFSSKGMEKRKLDKRNVWGTFNFTLFFWKEEDDLFSLHPYWGE